MTLYYDPVSSLFHIRNNTDSTLMPVSKERHAEIMLGLKSGRVLTSNQSGEPILIDPPPYVPTDKELCSAIDAAADSARRAVAGDPLRAVEYDRAATEAQAFKDAGYPAGAVPRTVSAWAINGRTAQQAADSILTEAAAYNEALYQIREARLQAKAMVRAAMDAGQVEQAQDIAAETIAAIEAAVAGIGNNA